MILTEPVPELQMTYRLYRMLSYLCTSMGLLLAVFLAPLHWLFIVVTILVAWGGPLMLEFAWHDPKPNHTPQARPQESVPPRKKFSLTHRPKFSSEEYAFNFSIIAMWGATLIALLEPHDTIWLLVLGFGFPLVIYRVKGSMRILRKSAR